MRNSFIYLLLLFISVVATGRQVQAGPGLVQADYLRCEYLVDPLAIEKPDPRLSWELDSQQRSQRQTAYQILVATSAGQLALGQGDLWDSGKVVSDNNTSVIYDGQPLSARQECFWKVRIWDADDNVSDWSEPALWSVGLLSSQDWQAQWIGYDPAEAIESVPVIMSQAKWIWTDPAAAAGTQPGTRYFRRNFTIPTNWTIKSAYCYITADDAYTLYVNGQELKSGTTHTIVSKVDLAESLIAGVNVIAIKATNEGSSANPAGLVSAVTIDSTTGSTMSLVTDSLWLCNNLEVADWKLPQFNTNGWSSALVLGNFGMSPWSGSTLMHLPPARYLRQDYTLAAKPIKRARVYVTALGIFQFYVNGQRVSQDYFSPGWTDYSKRVYYQTYDVTDLLQGGANAMGAVLADGWYAGYVGYAREREHYGKYLRLLCQLHIDYADGTSQTISSGPDWKAALGPITQADFLQGESYDARKELTNWDMPGYNDSDWSGVVTGSPEVNPLVQAAISQPVVEFAQVQPIAITEPSPGCYVFNMGQNFAGVVRLSVQGAPGQMIQLRHAEVLNADGTIYTANLRSAAATDTYICKGTGVEVWQPYFTFHGFQYVEVTGLTAAPSLDTIVGLALSSDTPGTGSFSCSDPMINKLQANSLWTQRMNFIDIPTDCPQRDERLGWTGDAQVYINTAIYHNDVQPFFTKWLRDLTDAQRADGQFPTVAPLKVSHGDGGPAWADAGVICPWTIYKMYGDKQILADNYDAMKRFIAFTKNRCTANLLPPASFHCFGDWLNINDNTPHDVIFMAYFGYCTDLMAQTAQVLGQAADQVYYEQLFTQIKAAFKSAYIDSSGKIKGDTQSAYVMALAYDLLDSTNKTQAANHLIRRIKECNWHLATGFVGTKDLMLALAKIDRNDIAYRLLFNDSFPSWGFSIKHGATTIWERWNGWTPESGFADPGMNSFAHYSFGAVCQWIFENIGGIQAGSPGFKHVILKPQPDDRLTWADTSFRSVRGLIKSKWQLNGSDFSYEITIPAGTTATVYVPASSAAAVRESGLPIAQAQGVTFLSFADGYALYSVDSGSYVFTSDMKWSSALWLNDSESTVSSGKVYTHKVNLNTTEGVTTAVNGVAFENDNGRSGANWALAGAHMAHSTGNPAVTGSGAALLTSFFYGQPATLTLNGLSAGQQYALNLYSRGWGEPGTRQVSITTSDNGQTATLDQNCYGDGQGGIFRYVYTAPASGSLSLSFQAVVSADTWHHYAFSNELLTANYIDPQPANDAVLTNETPLSWQFYGDIQADSYQLRIAADPALTDLIVDASNLTETEYMPALLFDTQYYWQVTACWQGGQYAGPVWSFTTDSAPVDAVRKLQWSFNETQGITAGQSGAVAGGSGLLTGFNAPDSPASRPVGIDGRALYLNGADEYVNVSSAYALMPTAVGQDFAISGYICTFDDFGPIFSMRNASSETPIIDIALGADGVQTLPGQICLLVRDNAGSYSTTRSGITVNDGRWHNLIVSRSEGNWQIFVDGQPTGSINGFATGAMTLDYMAIGTSLRWLADDWQSNNNHLRYFDGFVDEFAVWDGLLLTSQKNDLVNAVAKPTDIALDGSVNISDLDMLAGQWLADYQTPQQPVTVLEDMESYADTAQMQQNWVYTPETGYGQLALTLLNDPAGEFGKVMRLSYNFNGKMHAHVPFILGDRRVNSSLFDQLNIRIRKESGCQVSKIILDFYDGRFNLDPVSSGMHSKGRLIIDISSLPAGQWTDIISVLPDTIAFSSCRDLYQIVLSIEDGGLDTGSLLVDSLVLHDFAPDNIFTVQNARTDLDLDLKTDMTDLAILAADWLTE
ncbi:MAG: family 78 glycoside hydrolase catalytic domain [Sedimentisphaerales bacterium]|nr:family 78 glycoside hydrolase catalytic domain [Sedimentisphaerales bacterium]MBN2843382.1 family 78 glycoside hydrolase catalytic domain [Sedimentisphaerales bacterium]